MNIPDIYRAVSVTPPNDPDLRRYIRDGLAVTYDLQCTVPCKECHARPDIFRACPKCGSIQPARTLSTWNRCECGIWMVVCTGPVISVFVDVSELCDEINQTYEDTI